MIDCRCPQPIYQRPHTRRLLQRMNEELDPKPTLTVIPAGPFAPGIGSPKRKKVTAITEDAASRQYIP